MAADDKNTMTRLQVRVTPGASRNEITGFTDSVLHIRIAAPPVKGKANKELIDFLSRALNTSKSSLHLIKGHNSRNKVITLDGLTEPEIIRRISV